VALLINSSIVRPARQMRAADTIALSVSSAQSADPFLSTRSLCSFTSTSGRVVRPETGDCREMPPKQGGGQQSILCTSRSVCGPSERLGWHPSCADRLANLICVPAAALTSAHASPASFGTPRPDAGSPACGAVLEGIA